jgi:Tol biopolymer transport system component/predicted Ser/Thr protein kinase
MPLSAGTRLGPYEILAPLGAGGMGEVYRARDPRMGREVAIKISAERFSDRFSREVHAVAALNHPNICHLYDVGPDYLVMELIEGPTLAERIKQGSIPLDEALRIARQIADALEAAHEKGVIHRDLKPANIKVKADGTVKVLDFGLAKMAEPVDPGARTENSPTLTMDAATRIGVILGTAAYMAPEQAKGKAVDKRADIWAFGVVLYEMLAGERLFQHDDLTETLAAVVMKAPDLERTPFEVRRLLKKCLEKDPKKRLRDIGDVWELLEEPVAPLSAANQKAGRWVWPAVAVVLGVAAAAAGFEWWQATRSVEHTLVRLDVDLGPDVSLSINRRLGGRGVIISPDGSRIVYLTSVAGGRKLFTRRLDQPDATELPGTDGAGSPFFSPDGRWIGFLAEGKINKISVEGGAVVPLTGIAGTGGSTAAWGEAGIFFSRPLAGMIRIPADGGSPTPVTELANGEFGHLLPQVLPGGKAVLFAAYPTPTADSAGIEAVSLDGHGRKKLLPGGASPLYVASGHLLYMNKGVLFAVPFDADRLEKRGEAVPILNDVATAGGLNEAGQFDVSQTGMLVYVKGHGGGGLSVSVIQWLDSGGKTQPLIAKPGSYSDPSLSPDGKKLAVAVLEGSNLDIEVYDLQRETWTKLTLGDGSYRDPIWSPDGNYIVFGSEGRGMFWTRSDGGQPQSFTSGPAAQYPSSFSPDGKTLAFYESGSAPAQIWTVGLEEQGGTLKAGKPEQFLKSQFYDSRPVFSPDGRWLAYQSGGGPAEGELYVQGQGRRETVSNHGQHPVWSRNGHELVYQSGDQILAVSYSVKGDKLVLDKPRVWTAKLGGAQWDLAPDGKRLVVATRVESAEAPKQEHEVVFLENFFDELRRRAPVGK